MLFEKLRGAQVLAELSPEQWALLRPVGELMVAPIAFTVTSVTGRSRLNTMAPHSVQIPSRRPPTRLTF